MSKQEHQKYPSINGLRAISILIVVIHHLGLHEHILDGTYQYVWLRPFTKFIQDGHMGVNIFFVISGFLITSLMMKEESVSGSVSLKNFYIRRTLRIFPAYYFLLLVYFVLQLAGNIHLSPASWLSSITYTKYFNWHLDWETGHFWSLSIEEHFYLFWPLVFLGGDRFRKYFSLGLMILVPVLRLNQHFNPISWINDLTIFMRIDAIACGCFFALYKDRIVEKMSSSWNLYFGIAAVLYFFLRYFPAAALQIHESTEYIFIVLGQTQGTLGNILIAVIMMYSVFGPSGIWYRFLNTRVMDFIGLLSYSIYLWQQIFISGRDQWMTTFPQNVVLLFGVSLFSYYLIEKPFLKLKSKFSGDKPKNKTVSA